MGTLPPSYSVSTSISIFSTALEICIMSAVITGGSVNTVLGGEKCMYATVAAPEKQTETKAVVRIVPRVVIETDVWSDG